MGLPMPLHERFATGTEWVTTVPYGTIPVGTRIRIEGPFCDYITDPQYELYAPCTILDNEQGIDLPIDILG